MSKQAKNDELTLRLVGVIERLLDENAKLAARLPYTYTQPSITTPWTVTSTTLRKESE